MTYGRPGAACGLYLLRKCVTNFFCLFGIELSGQLDLFLFYILLLLKLLIAHALFFDLLWI